MGHAYFFKTLIYVPMCLFHLYKIAFNFLKPNDIIFALGRVHVGKLDASLIVNICELLLSKLSQDTDLSCLTAFILKPVVLQPCPLHLTEAGSVTDSKMQTIKQEICRLCGNTLGAIKLL